MLPLNEINEIEDVSFDSLKGFEKAAILLNYLGPDSTKKFFSHIDDMEIRKLLGAMGRLRVIPVDTTKRVLVEFYKMISESESYIFSDKAISAEIIIDAIGEERARGIFASSKPSTIKTLESLEKVDAPSLSHFLLNEHPQTMAVILAHLDPEKKGEVLKGLPEGLQAEIVLRLSNLDHVAPELISKLDQVLKQELSVIDTRGSVSLGGVQSVADMLNMMEESVEGSIMESVEERDPLLAAEIQRRMFVFEDLVKVNDQGIQMILREVPNNKLLWALKTADREVREKVFKNISQRAARLLKEDLDHLGPLKLSDVEAAQEEIINTAKKLEKAGQVIISRGGSKHTVV